MLELINRYLHGYVAIPVVLACRKRGFFELFQESKPLTLTNLANKLGANEGHLAVALRMFESLNWLNKNKENSYTLNIEHNTTQFILSIPESLLSLYAIPTLSLFKNHLHRKTLAHCLDKIAKLNLKCYSLEMN